MNATPNNRNNPRGRQQPNMKKRPRTGSVQSIQPPQNRRPQKQQASGQLHNAAIQQNSAQQSRLSTHNRPRQGARHAKQQKNQSPAAQRNQKIQQSTVAGRARTQTPSNRRAAKAARRIDPRQLEIQRRRNEAHRFYVRKKRQNAFRLFLGRFAIFLVMFAVIFSSSVGIILLRYYSYEKPADEILYQIGEDDGENTTSRTVKRESIAINDTLYINITEIALLCEFTTTGDLDEIRLISKNESNDNVKLVLDSPVITINSNPVRLSAPVFKSGDSIYVPIEFFTSYVTGIAVNYDEGNEKITIVREITGMTEAKLNKASEPIYADICFTLKYTETTDSIPEDSLDPDIRIATEPKPVETTES